MRIFPAVHEVNRQVVGKEISPESQAQFRHRALKRTGITEKNKAQGIMNPMSPRLLPLKRAADYLGLTVWGMRERIWAGDIPVVRFPGGRKMFIDTADLEVFIQRNKTTII